MNCEKKRKMFSDAEGMIVEATSGKRYLLFDSKNETSSKQWRYIVEGKFSFVLDLYTFKDRDYLNVSVGLYRVPEEQMDEVALDLLSLNESMALLAKFGRQDDILTFSSNFPLDFVNLDFIKSFLVRYIDTAEYHSKDIYERYELIALVHANSESTKASMN